MKRNLFILSLLAVCAVHAEIITPTGFERVDVTTGADFKAGGTWSFVDNAYVFVLGTDTEFVTSSSANTPMRDGAIYITSDTSAPVSFSATGLTNGRILQSTTMTSTVTPGKTYTWSGLDDVTIGQNSVSRSVSINQKKYVFGIIAGSHTSQTYSFKNNAGKVSLSGNTASHSTSTASITACGAALTALGLDSKVAFDNNAGGVSITSNTSRISTTANSGTVKGGALYVKDGRVSVKGNRGLVELSSNTAENNVSSARGGLATLSSEESSFVVCENTAGVQIDNNTASSTKSTAIASYLANGGAISSDNCFEAGVKILNNKGGVSISDNKAISTAGAGGGAMSVGYVDISGNKGELKIQKNFTESRLAANSSNGLSSKGGAIYVTRNASTASASDAALKISGNETVTISGNYAKSGADSAAGGAIYGDGSHSKVVISGNGAVTISDNYADGATGASGGAIYTRAGVFIEGNESVTLAGNYEKVTDPATGVATYRLRSIYQDDSSITTDATQLADSQFRLMAAKGNTIEIQDSVYSNRKKIDVVFNGSYGEMEKGEGTIRFTGKYTESVLQELKDGCNVTAEEIVASRTSEFASEIKLMGGRLELTDEACLKGVGFNAAAGSGAVLSLQNATFENKFINESYLQTGIVTFNSGTTLEVAGINNTLTAQTLKMEDNSIMKFMLSEDAATSSMLTLDVAGGLTKDVFDNIIIELSGVRTVGEGTYHLLSLSDSCSYVPDIDWDESKITLAGVTDASLLWSGNDLMVIIVPEPATATLSLLALSMLSARRRRK